MSLTASSPHQTGPNGREAILEITPQLQLEDLLLPLPARESGRQLLEEHRRADVLRANGYEPRHRVLLSGPPGNGKTSFAEAIAEGLGLPFFVVRYDALIGSYLGETNARLRKLFDYVRTTPSVLFFDEFDAIGRYVEACKNSVPRDFDLEGMRIAVDCAHGATYHIAPSVFRELGADVITMGCAPDGLNINDNVGSTAPKALVERVLQEKADLGIAFDGDGDRLIMVDHTGYEVDGDELLYIIARDLQQQGTLVGGVVGTLMTNLGLEVALTKLDIPLVRAKVGDRYVMELLQEKGWRLGGENSGHIICLDQTTTGDGIIASLQVLKAASRANKTLFELRKEIKKFPQILINVRFSGEHDPLSSVAVQQSVREVEQALGKTGRVLLRKSGTEPLIRVMVEGENEAEVKSFAEKIAAQVTAAK